MTAGSTLPRHESAVTGLSRKVSATVIRLREEAGMRPADFSVLMGISDAMVGALDRETRNWTTPMLERAAQVLHVAPHVLLMPEEEFVCPDCAGTPPGNRMCLWCRVRGPGEAPGARAAAERAEKFRRWVLDFLGYGEDEPPGEAAR